MLETLDTETYWKLDRLCYQCTNFLLYLEGWRLLRLLLLLLLLHDPLVSSTLRRRGLDRCGRTERGRGRQEGGAGRRRRRRVGLEGRQRGCVHEGGPAEGRVGRLVEAGVRVLGGEEVRLGRVEQGRVDRVRALDLLLVLLGEVHGGDRGRRGIFGGRPRQRQAQPGAILGGGVQAVVPGSKKPI